MGQMKNREDRKLLGTDKEKTILSKIIQFFFFYIIHQFTLFCFEQIPKLMRIKFWEKSAYK